MYDDDEEDLALLQQYEEEGANSSNDDLDSDLEDKIMSAVQYETDATHNWSTSSQHRQPQHQGSNSTNGQLATRSTIPPIDATQPTSGTAQPDFSNDDDSSISSFNGDDNSTENDDPFDNTSESNFGGPPIIRHIDLNITDKQLRQDDSTDDEEQVLNHELQELIDQQIRNRKQRQQPFRKPKQLPFCFSCLAPGHIQRECSLCNECGDERHSSALCPGPFYCHRCKERGHYAMDCRNKRCYDSCQHCGEDYHSSQCCPKLIHVYKNQVPPQQTVPRYCYNCGGKGHYGDECPTLPKSSQSQQSVFSFSSLSISRDPRRSSSQSSKRPRHHSSSQSQHHAPSHQRFDDHSDDSDSDRPAKKSNRPTKKREKSKSHHSDKHVKKYSGQQESSKGKHGNRQQENIKNRHGNGQPESSRGKHGHVQQETERGSGNNNWKALTKASSSSTSSRAGPGYTNNKIENDFPRNLPKPSFSGVINTEPAPRRPKYSGGYNRF